MKKKIITILVTFTVAVIISMLMGKEEVSAANVDLETFIKSVEAGEFVLGDKLYSEFVEAVKSGNYDKQMQIYKEYFHESDSTDKKSVNSTSVLTEVMVEEVEVVEADEAIEKKSSSSSSELISASGEDYEAVADPDEEYYVDETEYFTSEDAEDVVNPDAPQGETVKDGASRETVLTDADYMALCKMVQAEAGGQGEMGKLLIANVILNRVNSPRYPNTVMQVVSQHGQFQPFRNGRYIAAIPDAETNRAVDRALSGENHAAGILYFKSIRSKSNWSHKTLAFVYGGHMFYY